MKSRHVYDAEPSFWIGRLSRAITLALVDLRDQQPSMARRQLKATIDEFLRSPVPSDGLKDDLRGDLRRRM